MKKFCTLTAGIISGLLLISFNAHSALLYKTYLVRQIGGIDILCDPYVVQKHDWILKVFKQKGEISNKDFPTFLRIFKKINPNVKNLDIIRPGQHILIPLRKLLPGTMPGQASGIITIPFVSIMSIAELLGKHTTEYKVQKGDCVSKLIAQGFGIYGSQAYKDGIKLFKQINQGITDINSIKAGQTIKMPEASIQNESWYASMFDNSGKLIEDFNKKPNSDAINLSAFESEEKQNEPKSPLAEAASILEAKLINKGIYHFPRKDKKDIELNLSRYPVFEFKGGEKVICAGEEGFSEFKKEVIKSHWNNMKFAAFSVESSSEQVFDAVLAVIGKDNLKTSFSFSDRGVKVLIRAKWIIDKPSGTGQGINHLCIFWIDNIDQRIPDTILRYLLQHNIIIKELFRGNVEVEQLTEKENRYDYDENIVTISSTDQKIFVKDFLTAIGYNYTPNVHITFPYAGVQVKAVSNLISVDSGRPLLVDYGDLYGDSVGAIKKAGFDIVQIFKEDSVNLVMEKILHAINIKYQKHPRFNAAQRPGQQNVNLIVNGILINIKMDKKIFFPDSDLDHELVQFFKDMQIKLVLTYGTQINTDKHR
ncbi:MAG: hypothetical protein J7K84_02225 [Deltaproteobacteria bacterium]|nr:hypothetical protein [Deltaproteobacteria bacterium]